jgi:hypothetical protein
MMDIMSGNSDFRKFELNMTMNQFGANWDDVKETFEKDKETKVSEDFSSMSAYTIDFEMNITSLSTNNNMAQLGANDIANFFRKIADSLDGQKTALADGEEPYDIKDTGYEGKPIEELTPEEAKELISEDGYFGIKKTSDRVSNFIIESAGDDMEKLEAGRRGILMGFAWAEKSWGKELPDISVETTKQTLFKVDQVLGFPTGQDSALLDVEA